MIRRYESLLILLIMCVSVKRSKKTQQQKNDIKIPIIAAVGAFIMFVLAVVVLLVCRARRKKLSERNRAEIKKTDKSPTYGTYCNCNWNQNWHRHQDEYSNILSPSSC